MLAVLLAVTTIWHFTKQDTTSNLSLKDVVGNASAWAPEFTSWFGKTAPDMTITDINGKEHSIRDYRGKHVILVFWATWCIPCIIEIPHLNKNLLKDDYKNEYTSFIKKLVHQLYKWDIEKLNYTFDSYRELPTVKELKERIKL